jgi:hypothetical protein
MAASFKGKKRFTIEMISDNIKIIEPPDTLRLNRLDVTACRNPNTS